MIINWWHEQLESEPFDHRGDLNTFLLMPQILYGLTNKINLSVNTTLGFKAMNWKSKNHSIHHRDETTLSAFNNARGGILGDTKMIFRYVLRQTKSGSGFRVYTGAGLTIPSNNVLTSDPFFLRPDDDKEEHRHFSLSNGTYNSIIDMQVFYKRNINPVFFGGFLSFERPLAISKYGYLPPMITLLSFSASFMNYDKRESSFDYGFSLLHNSKAYWNDIYVPNSESLTAIPSIGYLFNSRFGVVSVNLQKPIFLSGTFTVNEGDIRQKSGVWQISLSLRYVR